MNELNLNPDDQISRNSLMADIPTDPISAHDSSEDAVTRESLYEQAWSLPMTKIALRYEVSSSYLARIFTELNIPRPPVGYWAQVAVGKNKPRPPLSDAKPGALIIWDRKREPMKTPTLLPKAPSKPKTKAKVAKPPLPQKHPILVDIEEHFKKAKEGENGYLRPSKRAMADLTVSRSGQPYAIDVANRIYLALLENGLHVSNAAASMRLNRVAVDHREKDSNRYFYPSLWQPQRPTVVYLGTVAFGLAVYEISEYVEVKHVDKHYVRLSSLPASKRSSRYTKEWVMSADMPSGRLCLQIYSPYSGAEWVHKWNEDKPGDLIKKIPSILKLLMAEAPVLANKVEVVHERREREREKYELECEERRRQDEEKRRLKMIQDSRDQLDAVIQTWAKVNSIQAFFDDIERRSKKLGDEEQKALMQRLSQAKELIGDICALKYFAQWKPPVT